MENLSLGLLLMVVGMPTVFLILLIIIYLGKGLIAFVNRFIP
jgi:oxaloacetate decarboxylase gamma subunit